MKSTDLCNCYKTFGSCCAFKTSGCPVVSTNVSTLQAQKPDSYFIYIASKLYIKPNFALVF